MISSFRQLPVLLALSVLPVTATVASAQTQNPPVRIYQFTGVYQDDATANTGTATVFTCTNFSNFGATLRFVIRDDVGTVVADKSAGLSPKNTFSYSTKATVAHSEVYLDVQGSIKNGSMAMTSSELEVRCVGKVVSASSAQPTGYVLPFARYFQTNGAAE